jgi:hypothetical protein
MGRPKKKAPQTGLEKLQEEYHSYRGQAGKIVSNRLNYIE